MTLKSMALISHYHLNNFELTQECLSVDITVTKIKITKSRKSYKNRKSGICKSIAIFVPNIKLHVLTSSSTAETTMVEPKYFHRHLK